MKIYKLNYFLEKIISSHNEKTHNRLHLKTCFTDIQFSSLRLRNKVQHTSLSTTEGSSGSKADLLVLASFSLTVGVEVTAGIYFFVGQLPALVADS